MAKKRRKKGLQSYAEEFALSLIYEATSGKVGKGKALEDEKENSVSFRDRRSLLDSITKLLGAQDEPEDDEEDGLTTLRGRLNDGDSGTTSSGASDGED